jgi:hypothetical protein
MGWDDDDDEEIEFLFSMKAKAAAEDEKPDEAELPFGSLKEPLVDDERLPFDSLNEPLKDTEKLPPLVPLSTLTYRFWLDSEHTLPCVIYSEKRGRYAHAGTNKPGNIEKMRKALAKKGIIVFDDA